MTKSQKKVVKKFNNQINNGIRRAVECTPQNGDDDADENGGGQVKEDFHEETPTEIKKILSKTIEKRVPKIGNSSIQPDNADAKEVRTNSIADGEKKSECSKLVKKAKKQRIDESSASLNKKSQNHKKSLKEVLDEISPNSKHKFRLQLFNANTKNENPKRDEIVQLEFELYRKYQMQIHRDPYENCTMDRFVRFLINSPLEITLERLNEGHKHFKEAAVVYAKYQIKIHGDDPTDCEENQFLDFLVETPLKYVKISSDDESSEEEVGFGSFHQLYWLDDKLIAVGVIDILPKCVSAVYFFYDPEYKALTLGTYGALREVDFATKLHQIRPSVQYYYMGYYVHTCPKMSYKGRYAPSFLLCPETYRWSAIERCVVKLDAKKFARLVDDANALDEDRCETLDGIKLLYNDTLISYKDFMQKYGLRIKSFEAISNALSCACLENLVFIVNK